MKPFKTFGVTQHQPSFLSQILAASKFSMLATECSYNILLMLDYIKKKKKTANVFSLNIPILIHLTNAMATMNNCFHTQPSLFHINKYITILFPCD